MATELGKRLKALRARAGLSSRDVAAMLEMPASTYQKYEDRYQKPHLPLAMAAKLVNALIDKGIQPEETWALAAPDQVQAFLEAWSARAEGSAGLAPTARPADEIDWSTGLGSRRRYERWSPLPAEIAMNGESHPCVVKDISPGGACVLAEAAEKLHEAAEVLLRLSEYGAVPAQITYRVGNEIGLTFEGDAQAERNVAAWLQPMRDVRH